MVEPSELFGSGRAMLLVGAVLLYVASRAGAQALGGTDDSPGRRALGNWIPDRGGGDRGHHHAAGRLALSIIFATSVGCSVTALWGRSL